MHYSRGIRARISCMHCCTARTAQCRDTPTVSLGRSSASMASHERGGQPVPHVYAWGNGEQSMHDRPGSQHSRHAAAKPASASANYIYR